MGNSYLESIAIRIPNDLEFSNQLLSMFEGLGSNREGLFEFTCSSPDFYPRFRLEFASNLQDVWVDFTRSNKQVTSIKVENSTGMEKQSPHTYGFVSAGEAWDFILPGDCTEILAGKEIDYSIPRRPKFEMVSFEKTSKPLIQIDLSTPATYDTLARLFPESLKDPQIGNVWIYLDQRCKIDVCLVINPFSEQDWSDFFKGLRL
jgi:hypothetical protein